jgi:hypothetical protein
MSSINKFDGYDINRGVELMLRGRDKNSIPEQLQERKFKFNRIFSFLQREIKFNIELSIIRKI